MKLLIHSREEIPLRDYQISGSVLVPKNILQTSNGVKVLTENSPNRKSYSFQPVDSICREQLSYYANFPHIATIMSSTERPSKQWESEIQIHCTPKFLNWGDLWVKSHDNLDFSSHEFFQLRVEFVDEGKGAHNLFLVKEEPHLEYQAHYPLLEEGEDLVLGEMKKFYPTENFKDLKKQQQEEERKQQRAAQKEKTIEDPSYEKKEFVIDGEGVFLVRGRVKFWKEKEYHPPFWQKAEIEKLQLERDEYFKFWSQALLWEKYNVLKKISLQDPRNLPQIKSVDERDRDIKIEIEIKSKNKKIESLISFDPTDDLECFSLFEEMDEIVMPEDLQQKKSIIEETYNKIKIPSGVRLEVQDRKGDFFSVEKTFPLPREGQRVVVDVKGDITQIKRMEEALRSFTYASNPRLHLTELLSEKKEEKSIIDSISLKEKRFPAYTSTTISELFFDKNTGRVKNLPTESQKQAIEVSLKTQDLTVIQGPPGTGKTTVAKSLCQRLSEIYSDSTDFRILLSSYQHVAVNNIAERIEVEGFPVLRARTREEKDKQDLPKTLKEWGEKKQTILCKEYEKNSGRTIEAKPLSLTDAENKLIKFIVFPQAIFPRQTAENSSDDSLSYNTKPLKTYTKELSFLLLEGGFLLEEVEELERKEQQIRCSHKTSAILQKLIGNEESFKIGLDTLDARGTTHPKEVVVELLEDEMREYCDEESLENSPLNSQLSIDEIITQYREKRDEYRQEYKQEYSEIISKLRIRAEDIRFKRASKKDILADYIYQLGNNKQGLFQGVQQWTRVYASTLQGIERMKLDYDKDFHAIIVDEAGRSDPLNLLIPMTNSEGKVIFLGDQNQLPPFVDSEKESFFMGKEEEKEWLKNSYFGKIYDHLEKTGKTVMLNEQFRSHPTLGNAISKVFYEEKLKSPRKASEFKTFDESSLRAPFDWIDIPSSKEEAQRDDSKSWYRRAEADEIAEKVEELLELYPDIEIGCITAYNAQVKKIEEILKNKNIKTDGENLLVGTIDSFQGREFDIVFLSLARTIEDKGSSYGNLESKNRMCVALSRQKSCLVIVGQRELIKNEKSQTKLVYLTDFVQEAEKNE